MSIRKWAPAAVRLVATAGLVAGLSSGLAACETGGAPPETPPITPGTSAVPRELNVIAREYAFEPPIVDLVPGETVQLNVVNAGLEVHDAVFGDAAVQAAWEAAEAAAAGHPPGPTPAVSVSPDLAGLRVVMRSGETVSMLWTVPASGPGAPGGWFVRCHIPGHEALGMTAGIRWVGPAGRPIEVVPFPTE